MADQTWWPIDSTKSDSKTQSVLGGSTATKKNNGANLDKDAFLLLLVTQMQNQDPLNPMDNKDTIAQLAQFSALEQMQNLNKTSTQTQAYAMLGKIGVADTYNEKSEQNERLIGVVESVSMKNGEAYVTISGTEVAMSKVTEVYGTIDELEQLGNINSNISSLQAIGLVGKTIQGINFDDKNNPIEFVEGKIDYIKVTAGDVILVIGDKNVYLSNVVSVAEDSLLIGKEVSVPVTNEDGESENVLGKVTSVKFDEDKRYLIVNGKEIEIENISDVTEAISLIDKKLTVGDITGIVSGVSIQDKKPVLLIGEEQIPLADVKK